MLHAPSQSVEQLAELLPIEAILSTWSQQYSPATLRTYKFHLRKFIQWCWAQSLDMRSLDASHIVQHIEQCGSKPAYKSARFGVIRRWLAAAYQRGLIPKNPAAELPAIHVPQPVTEYLTLNELAHLLHHCNTLRRRMTVGLMALAGLRLAEVCDLKWSSIIGGRRLRIIGKGSKVRTVMLREDLARVLLEAHEHAGWPSPWPWSRTTARHEVLAALKDAGLRRPGLACHALRHTHATLAYHATHDLQRVQHALGHSRIDTTGRYVHAAQELDSLGETIAAKLPRQSSGAKARRENGPPGARRSGGKKSRCETGTEARSGRTSGGTRTERKRPFRE